MCSKQERAFCTGLPDIYIHCLCIITMIFGAYSMKSKLLKFWSEISVRSINNYINILQNSLHFKIIMVLFVASKFFVFFKILLMWRYLPKIQSILWYQRVVMKTYYTN